MSILHVFLFTTPFCPASALITASKKASVLRCHDASKVEPHYNEVGYN